MISLFRKITEFCRDLFRRRRVSVQNASDNSEEWSVHLSPASFFSAFVAVALLLFILILVFMAYTPVLEFLPGYSTQADRSREQLIANIMRLDSMEHVMHSMITYNGNISLILEGKTPVIPYNPDSDTTRLQKDPVPRSAADSALRSQMEGEGAYALNRSGSKRSVREAIELLKPVEGIIARRFDARNEQFGVVIGTSNESQVAAVNDGTVVLVLWTPDSGQLVEIQHANNMVTLYRNLSASLVTVGQSVRAGEIIGSTMASVRDGEVRQFEFQLWQNGKPVDPEAYIVF